VLEVRDLRARYGKVEVVRGVDLQVRPGQITLVFGANGAGKTTTLHSIVGVHSAATGEVLLNGQSIAGRPAHDIVRRGLALVPEGRRIFAPLTVAENLRLGGHTVSGRARQASFDRVLEMFPILAERRNGAAGLLSGGEQQMLAFGRALMASPSFIMMDEPSMGLAPAITNQIMSVARTIADTGIGVLMVEQNVEAGLSVADEVVVMTRGEIVFSGVAADAKANESVILAFLGESAISR
jgi:branched-chain amino acid transport system ATP-binding protein